MIGMHLIDLKAVLQRTVSSVYGDLVTRPTGKAVRGGIEEMLAEIDNQQVAVIDFGQVRCLDISCADEIVGKLLIEHGGARYLLLQGVSDSHREAIQQVLERHGLAVVARDRDGRLQLLGPTGDLVRRAFGVLTEQGVARAEEIAERLAVEPAAARQALADLWERRLVQHIADRYEVLRVP
jgi:hypothetical protein